MLVREAIERREEETLAPWALRAGNSAGRLSLEPPHTYRTEYQRDRDRITHSRAFRRLQFKTQVFPFQEGDHFRNRLTHTLEVSQIARTVARALGANEDLTEAIVLAHDLGHPPFGHAGEKVLHDLLGEHGGFEHNRQSLRTIDLIEVRSDEYRGLNLTCETRAGILKHGVGHPRFGHPVELPELGRQPSVEAQIANLTDSIAYHAHDIDDGLRSRVLDAGALAEVPLWQRALQRSGGLATASSAVVRQRATVALIDELATDLITSSGQRLEAADLACAEDVRRCPEALVGLSPKLESESRQLAEFLQRDFYRHSSVLRLSARAGQILGELWRGYLDSPRLLPPATLEPAPGEPRERAIADYIAGMTDRFALDEHHRLVASRS